MLVKFECLGLDKIKTSVDQPKATPVSRISFGFKSSATKASSTSRGMIS